MHHIQYLCIFDVFLACQAATLAIEPNSRITHHGSSRTGPQNPNSRILSNSSIGSPLYTPPLTEKFLHCDGDKYGRELDEWSCLAAANNFWTMRQEISFGPRGSAAYMKTPWRISSRESCYIPTPVHSVMSAYIRPLRNSGREMCI